MHFKAIDWSLFLQLVKRHRVQGLVWQGLFELDAPVPQGVRDEVESGAATVAEQNLRIAVESAGLLSDFHQAELPLIFLKGLSLGALAYRRPLVKMGWDIDLLIRPADLRSAARLLVKREYSPVLPKAAPDSEELIRWHQREKESVWRREKAGIYLELHTRPADNVAIIPQIYASSPAQLVNIVPGIQLPTLNFDELFAYLSVHGASSAWFRLKWLADFAALVSRNDASNVERLYQKSHELKAGRAAAWALLLADEIFGIPLSPDLRRRLTKDRMNLLLLGVSRRQLLADQEPTESKLGTLPIHLSQLALLPGLRFKAEELGRQLGSMIFR